MLLRMLFAVTILALVGSTGARAQATVRVSATILPHARLAAGPQVILDSSDSSIRVHARPAEAQSFLTYSLDVPATPRAAGQGAGSVPSSQSGAAPGQPGVRATGVDPATSAVRCDASVCVVAATPAGTTPVVVRWLVVPNV